MRKLILYLILAASPLLAQQQYGALTYAGGVWSPALSSGTALPTSLTPQTISLFCYNSSLKKWVAADSSCFGGGSGPVPVMPASGDTTGVADTTACNALTTAGTSFMFGAGPYYMSTCNVPNPILITGLGNFVSVIHETSATAYLWNISANGVTIRDLYMDTKIGVTQSAGGVFKVTNSTPIGSIYIQDNVATGAWWSGFKVGPNVLDSYFQNNHYGTTVTTGDGAIYLDNPGPYGDNWFNDNYLYSSPGIQINASDINFFDHDKILTGNVKFLQGAAATGLLFSDMSIEQMVSAENCGYDFGTGGFPPPGITITGGEIGSGANAFCNLQNAIGNSLGVVNLNLNNLTNETTGIYSIGQAPYVSPIKDTFVGTIGTNLGSHSASPGGLWTQTFISIWGGNMVLAGTNQVNLDATAAIAVYYQPEIMTSPDYTVTLGCTLGSSGSGLCAPMGRMTGIDAGALYGYACTFTQGTGVKLVSIAGVGVQTQIGTTYAGVSSGTHTVSLVMKGPAISCNLDGSPVAGPSGIDYTYMAAGFSGMIFDNGATTGYFVNPPFTAH